MLSSRCLTPAYPRFWVFSDCTFLDNSTPDKANNTWTVKNAGDGYYYIISLLSDGKKGYLTVEGGKDTDGANIVISSFDGSDSQKFKLKPTGGSYLLLTKCSDENAVSRS